MSWEIVTLPLAGIVTSQLSPAPLSTATSQRHVSGNEVCSPIAVHTSW